MRAYWPPLTHRQAGQLTHVPGELRPFIADCMSIGNYGLVGEPPAQCVHGRRWRPCRYPRCANPQDGPCHDCGFCVAAAEDTYAEEPDVQRPDARTGSDPGGTS